MKKQILIALAAILIGVLITIGSGAAGGPGGGPPGGGGAPGGGGGGGGGFVPPNPSKQNTEWAYNGLVVSIANDYIEIQNSPIRPNEEWWIEPMKIGIGEDTRVSGLGNDLSDIQTGQHVQVTGIFAKEGLGLPTDYLTTDYWGYHGRDIHHGTIQIMNTNTSLLIAHQEWVEKENARRVEYGLLKKYGYVK